MFDTGYATIARFRGAPIRLHWSVPLGAVAFTGFRFVPGAWLALVLLILMHELGHAVLVSSRKLRILSIDVTGLGGLCRFEGDVSPLSHAIIAWGGVLAQGLAGATAIGLLLTLGWPSNPFLAQFVSGFLWPNLMMAAFNLVPIRPLDGEQAWQLPRIILRRWRHRRAQRRIARARVAQSGEHVHETVREALARAQRESRERQREN